MEREHKSQEGAVPPEEERALFERVWRRVAESGGSEGPIEPLPPVPPEGLAGLPAPAPAERREADPTCGALREALRSALEAAGVYASLARRLGGRPGGQGLRSLAQRARRRSKRLAVACFLLDGVWYLPRTPSGQNRSATLMGALRERYLAERRSEEACRSASVRTGDRELAELWLDLAEESRESARLLRQLLEAL